MNYYLFGVTGIGIDEHLKEARGKLIQKIKNKVEIFNLLLEEGVKNKLLAELFKDIESQLKEGNKVINNDSTIVFWRLNHKKVIIKVDSSAEKEKKDIMSLLEKLRILHGKKEDSPKQFPKGKLSTLPESLLHKLWKFLEPIINQSPKKT